MTAFKILLVEDNEGDVMVVERALENWRDGCTLTVANNGLQALEYLGYQDEFSDAVKPDLILLDINMPVMNGKEFLKKLKHDEQLRLIPVVMLTSSRAPSDIIDCYKNYTSSYIVKPFGARAYIDAVRQAVAFWWDLAQRPSHVTW